jgi:hypothetical protein
MRNWQYSILDCSECVKNRYLNQVGVQCLSPANVEVKFQIPLKAVNFLAI